ncbi:sirohydrochlorin chelatase [Paenibacillus wulumuqiensis]|uniref:sirohydrochlorin chelatase n=1 Tax=Paenibacillus wulumuqiensis TaxID=1567107 RepID=UPI000619C246|nr:CbiX/SirB N-terminal domain-containing protein [Paenibacillus wulumuqiensis]
MMKPGVLIISHGSPDPTWMHWIDDAVANTSFPADLPVSAVYLDNVPGRFIQDGIDELEGQGVTDLLVIPLFVSSGSTHMDEIAYALGVKAEPDRETDLEPFTIRANVHFGYPVDDDDDIAHMVWDKVKHLSTVPQEETVLVVGHGSIHDGFRQRWEKGISSLARRVGDISGTAHADYALLNPDSLRSKTEEWTSRGYRVLVAPLFLSSGIFLRSVIPGRIEGLSYEYAGEALLPHPRLSHWMERQVDLLMQQLQVVE